jgi:tetratricopeptide (TPR) repeat protein
VSDSVVCAACGARIRADRERCLRCGEILIDAGRAASGVPSLNLSKGQLLMIGTVASFVILALGVILWQTDAPVADEAARPLSSPAAAAAPRRDSSVTTNRAQVANDLAESATFVDVARSGGAAFAVGNFESARASYEQALAKKPDDPDALNSLGQVLVRLGKVDEAVVRFERAVALAPSKSTYHFNLAHAVGQLGLWDRAVEEYRAAVALFPEDYATQFNLAMALHKKGDDPAAIPEFEKAIQLAPAEPSFHLSLAVSLEKTGRVPDALEHYRQYLAMAPSAPDASRVKAHIDALAAARPAPATASATP